MLITERFWDLRHSQFITAAFYLTHFICSSSSVPPSLYTPHSHCLSHLEPWSALRYLFPCNCHQVLAHQGTLGLCKLKSMVQNYSTCVKVTWVSMCKVAWRLLILVCPWNPWRCPCSPLVASVICMTAEQIGIISTLYQPLQARFLRGPGWGGLACLLTLYRPSRQLGQD